ncbi:MAG: hypothetical protein GTN73_02625 [Candidatus Aminicenantes bacterium]|nr:hypothetical protein [Candidatus Aminicenantes bacterium]
MREKERKITKDMLKKESFYIKAKLLNLARRGGMRLKATSKMADIVINFSNKALRAEKPVVLTSIWCPSEILYALDVIPINVESVATFLASYGLGDEYLAVAEKNFHPPETCSVRRCAAGAVLDRLPPSPLLLLLPLISAMQELKWSLQQVAFMTVNTS